MLGKTTVENCGMEQRENVENNAKRLSIFQKLCPQLKTKEHARKENTKGKHLPTLCEGRTDVCLTMDSNL